MGCKVPESLWTLFGRGGSSLLVIMVNVPGQLARQFHCTFNWQREHKIQPAAYVTTGAPHLCSFVINEGEHNLAPPTTQCRMERWA